MAEIATLARPYAEAVFKLADEAGRLGDWSEVVRAMAHRVLVLKDGVIVEQGEAQALFAAPREPYTQALLAAAHLA